MIAPAYVGICGSDLHVYLGEITPGPTESQPGGKDTIPIALGHEFSGIVTEVGSSDSALSVGQKVCIQPTIYCGTCEACKEGYENVCLNGGFIGLSGSSSGGLSDSVVVPEAAVLQLPPNVPLDVGALVEPLSVAWHAVSAAPLSAGSTALILGGGPIGLAIVRCLVAKGVGNIIVSEISETRQRVAREFGAHHVLCPKKCDVVETSKTLSSGGPHVVFDCAGVPASLATACTAVRPRGTIVNVAIWETEVPFNPNLLVRREAKYTAVLGYQREDFQAVLDLLASGKLKPSDMITRKIQLEDLVESGIKALIHDKENQVKILVEVGALRRG